MKRGMRDIAAALAACWLLLPSAPAGAGPLEDEAWAKIAALEGLIADAQVQGLDALKEQMTASTARVFLGYAAWDEAHLDINSNLFAQVAAYKTNPQYWAQLLPDFERSEVVKMLDEATTNLVRLKAGEIVRRPVPNVDWAQVSHDGDQLTFNGRPVFVADYTWKPDVAELNTFHGNQDGYYFDQNKVASSHNVVSWMVNELNGKPDGTLGFVFLGNKVVPSWAETEYGPGFKMREDTYTAYDIDNPGARLLNGYLLEDTVPLMAGKQYSQLGYMLCNEPHFYTTKKTDGTWDWASGPVSAYTRAKFRTWLQERHGAIVTLNALWGTAFASFAEVDVDIPMSVGEQGSAMWYDWHLFNNWRVTQWYIWLKSEFRKHDPSAKIHLKIMPNLWSSNKRGHGIDMEALTELSEIVGNDAGAAYNHMWGPVEEWEARYIFDWREMCMSYDFYKSVAPGKIMFNSEAHYLSTGKSRDLYMKPEYARATYWLAHVHGLNASQTWYWTRDASGAVGIDEGSGYAGSNNQQPRVVNEVAATIMDLNAHAEEIAAMQRQRKPLRIFYSETEALNRSGYMDDLYHLYEALFFEGVPVGFATANILNHQDPGLWDCVLVRQTGSVTTNELAALQAYLDGGGTVIVDAASLQADEYGRPVPALVASGGTLIYAGTTAAMKSAALGLLDARGALPPVAVAESNAIGAKGCTWKCVDNAAGNHVLSIVNLGRTAATLAISVKDPLAAPACRELLTGVEAGLNPVLKPYEVLFIEIAPHGFAASAAIQWGLSGGDPDIVTNTQPFAVKTVNYVEGQAANPAVGPAYYPNHAERAPVFNHASSSTYNAKEVVNASYGDTLRSGKNMGIYDCMYAWENLPSGYSTLASLEAEVRLAMWGGTGTGTVHWIVQKNNGDWLASGGVDLTQYNAESATFTRLDVPDAASLAWFDFTPVANGHASLGDAATNDLAQVKSVGLYFHLSGSGENIMADMRYFKATLSAGPPATGWEEFVARYGLGGVATNDFDLDGQVDLVEYALGGNPTNPAILGQPPGLAYGDDDYVDFSHLVLTNANPGIAYAAEWTDNLVTGVWSAAWQGATSLPSAVPGYGQAVLRLYGGTNDHLYFRLQVTQP